MDPPGPASAYHKLGEAPLQRVDRKCRSLGARAVNGLYPYVTNHHSSVFVPLTVAIFLYIPNQLGSARR